MSSAAVVIGALRVNLAIKCDSSLCINQSYEIRNSPLNLSICGGPGFYPFEIPVFFFYVT